MRFIALCCVLLMATTVYGSLVPMKVKPNYKTQEQTDLLKQLRTPEFDLCPTCFSLMSDAINDLLEYILNGGVLGTCGDLCGYLSNSIEQGVCNLLCDYVGINAFVDAINVTDPDPIYVCQEIDLCPVVNGGAVTTLNASVDPTKGAQGTTFTIYYGFKVTSPTGPGYVVVNVNCPDGSSVGGGEFSEGFGNGAYTISFSLEASPSEQESFGPGNYQVIVAVCEGDCTTDHPYGGIYAEGETSFAITQ